MLLKRGSLRNTSDAYDKRALYTLQKSPIRCGKSPIYENSAQVWLSPKFLRRL